MTAPLQQASTQKLYWETAFEKNAARILPGEYHVTRDDIVLITVLGSCVAACVRDPQTGIGGMNHFMLPDAAPSGGGTAAADSAPARYGSYAMEVLINQLVKLGARRERLEAKVFGGASVIPGMKQVNIGQRNADFVLQFLRTERIPVVARDLEDECPRKVAFFPRTGLVRVKRLGEGEPLSAQEQQYRKRLAAAPITGEVELFG